MHRNRSNSRSVQLQNFGDLAPAEGTFGEIQRRSALITGHVRTGKKGAVQVALEAEFAEVLVLLVLGRRRRGR